MVVNDSPFIRCLKAAGSQATFAQIVNCTQQAISKRPHAAPLPAEWCVALESALGIPRHELRPDIFDAPKVEDAA